MAAGGPPGDASARKDAERISASVEATPAVLVVEDDPAVADITCRMVRVAGYRCDWVCTGKEAVAFVESRAIPPDLVVIDIVLPDMLGTELARRLAQRCPTAPVIFTSAYPEYRLEPPLTERGRFLPKPYSGAELTEALHEFLPAIAAFPR